LPDLLEEPGRGFADSSPIAIEQVEQIENIEL
jgi:hypothetical protein